jgi:electron transfer flavoprotein beta subunit
MDFIVCVKQVPDTTEVEVDRESGTIMREGVPSILNPFDEFALNEAIRVKEKTGGRITVLSMGPPQAQEALRKCLAIGADEAILLTDRAFAGSDTWATSFTLARAIEKIGNYDLIFCGQQATDGDTAQVGPELARQLNVPQMTYVESVEDIDDGAVICKKETDGGYQRVKCGLPALLAFISTPAFEPKIPSIMEVMGAKSKTLSQWGMDELGDEDGDYGLDGSPTQVIRIYAPPERGEGVRIEEPPEVAADKLIEYLESEGII